MGTNSLLSNCSFLSHKILQIIIIYALSLSTPCMAAPASSCVENMENGHRNQDPNPKEVRTEKTKLEFSEDEEMLIARMFNLVGQRWSLIAGRIPGRTAEEIEKYWRSRHDSQSQNER